jgi:hypothetical protein
VFILLSLEIWACPEKCYRVRSYNLHKAISNIHRKKRRDVKDGKFTKLLFVV